MSIFTIKKLGLFSQFFVILFSIVFTISLSAQTKKYPVPPPWNVYIDSIPFPWPHDSTFVKDEIIIRFKPDAIILEKLCVDYYNFQQESIKSKKKSEQPMSNLQAELASYLYSQSFPVDSLISVAPLANFMKNNGATTLHRISVASPCRDTISITRRGDTIGNSSYLWMKLKFNNDTVALFSAIALTAFFQDQIEYSTPNMLGEFLSRTPTGDESFDLQRSLYSSTFDMPTAWDYTTGHPNVKIGILEAGVDSLHCEFGGGLGSGFKLQYGFNFATSNTQIRGPEPLNRARVEHGTMVSGIIGALTNYSCGDPERGVARVNGGWYPESIGSPLYLFGVGSTNVPTPYSRLSTDYFMSALIDGAASNPDPVMNYGYEIDVFNLSLGFKTLQSPVFEALRGAIISAYNNGAVIVTAAGNEGTLDYDAVTCINPQIVINVGSAHYDNTKKDISTFNEFIDVLAYGGVRRNPTDNSELHKLERTVYTTTAADFFADSIYTWVDGTSFAAPHITGLVSLLQSYEKEKVKPELLRPEDYEGIIKANTFDAFASPAQQNYDMYTGWGVARAGKIFTRYDNDGYAVYHNHYNDIENFTQSGWSDPFSLHIANIGGQSSLPEPGLYTVRLKTWTRTIPLILDDWKRGNGNNVYVWGLGGEGLSFSGWDTLPYKFPTTDWYFSHYKNNFTVINSGDGGNGIVKGILHTNNDEISASTFQYQVWKGNDFIGYFPPNEKIGVNFSIYGALEIPTSVEEQSFSSSKNISISPSITSTKSTVSYLFPFSGEVLLKISDSRGNIVYSISKHYENGAKAIEQIDGTYLSNGLYSIVVIHSQTGEVLQTKCAVLR